MMVTWNERAARILVTKIGRSCEQASVLHQSHHLFLKIQSSLGSPTFSHRYHGLWTAALIGVSLNRRPQNSWKLKETRQLGRKPAIKTSMALSWTLHIFCHCFCPSSDAGSATLPGLRPNRLTQTPLGIHGILFGRQVGCQTVQI